MNVDLRRRRWRAGRTDRAILLALGAVLLGGCLGEPRLEDRWTRIDLAGSDPAPFQTLRLGTQQPVSVHAAITYRSILTGFAVAELRASTLTPASVVVHPDAERLPMAQDIDRILANSVSVGRATRAVTGWDHLIQPIDFSFVGSIPAVLDTSASGSGGGLFLVCYLGSGVRIELASGADSIVVTPFGSTAYQLLPVGMELGATP